MKMKEENLDLPNDMLTLFLKEKSKFKNFLSNCKVPEVYSYPDGISWHRVWCILLDTELQRSLQVCG